MLKVLRTNNNITLFSNGNCCATNNLLVNLFNDIIEKYNYSDSISVNFVENVNIEKEILEIQQSTDLLIYIGDKYDYKKLTKYLYVKSIYNGYGTATLYAENNTFTDVLKQMDIFAYENNIGIDLYKSSDELIQSLKDVPYTTDLIVLTKDNKLAFKFIQEGVFENIYINVNPFKNYKFVFDEKQLVCQKNINI